MLTSALNATRKMLRFAAGMLFWLNALLVVSVPRPSFPSTEATFGLRPSEALLIGLLLALTLLNSYGFGKFLVDVLYIYAFPFIALYRVAALLLKALWSTSKLATWFAPRRSSAVNWKDALALLNPSFSPVPIPQTIEVQSSAPASPPVATEKTRRDAGELIWQTLQFPLFKCTFWWCLLLAATDRRSLVAISFALLLVNLARFCTVLGSLAATANRFLSTAEARVRTYMETMLAKIMAASVDAPANPDVAQAVSVLLLYRVCAFLLINLSELAYGLFIVGCVLYGVVYLRLSLLFGFIYLGIAKLRGLQFGFLDSMLNSLGMPFAYTFFPRDWAVQSAQLVHTAIVVALGIGAITAYVRRKIQSFGGIAQDVWSRLQQEDVRTRIDELWRKTSAGQSGSKPHATA